MNGPNALFLLLVFQMSSSFLWAQSSIEGRTSGLVQSCATCSPVTFVEQARKKMESALFHRLIKGQNPKEIANSALNRAQLYREQGLIHRAFIDAKKASARCLVRGDALVCAESISLLAELTLQLGTGDKRQEGEVLALLSLVDASLLSRRECEQTTVLRYRLAESHIPRLAPGHWADTCGGFGATGELGYRSSKAALLQGDLDEAAERLAFLGSSDAQRAVRSDYLRAVLDVARGANNAAMRKFRAIAELEPSATRSFDEDQARILSFLQLGRLLRAAGKQEEAILAYQGVPSSDVHRKEALLESAIASAHLGHLQQAKAFLDAVATNHADVRARVSVQRLRASLAVIDGDEESAMQQFTLLSEEGTRFRAQIGLESNPEERLRSTPGLGGLLDESEGKRLNELEQEWAAAQNALLATKETEQKLREELLEKGAPGPVREALLELDEADALLRRAENLTAARLKRGVRVAGPATSALSLQREVLALRKTLDAHRKRLQGQQAQNTKKMLALLDDERGRLRRKEKQLVALSKEAEHVVRFGRKRLWKKAEDAVVDLELAREVGDLELSWRKKRRHSQEIQRITKEYTEGMATLKHDVTDGAAE
ncbi:MAG: hypothetical protein GY822_05720 [Deltaproteobacteria bacterium]|nr:hypothetical protein [Deltaproteobacteria bacterium]